MPKPKKRFSQHIPSTPPPESSRSLPVVADKTCFLIGAKIKLAITKICAHYLCLKTIFRYRQLMYLSVSYFKVYTRTHYDTTILFGRIITRFLIVLCTYSI